MIITGLHPRVSRALKHAVVLVALLFAPVLSVSAQQPNVANLQSQLTRLTASLRSADSAIKRLEARIATLERKDEESIDEAEKDEAEDDKTVASLEKRVAALERTSSDAKEGSSSSKDPRAPFEIRDTDGRVIFRVTGGKSPRLMIGVENGGQVEMGTGSAGGGVVRVRDASSTDRALIIATTEFGQYRAVSPGYSAVLTAGGEDGSVLTLSKGDTPSARLRSGILGYGGFILTDPSGTELVKGGSIKGEKGVFGLVWTGPRGFAGTMGPQNQIMGRP